MNLEILGNKVKVEIDGEMKDNLGEFTGDDLSIKLKSAEERMSSTLVHEIIHAILYVTGVKEFLSTKQEEAVAYALEHGLKATLINGKKILKMPEIREDIDVQKIQ